MQESIDVDQEHLEQLIKQQQYLKKSVGLSNYRSFDPQNPTLLSLITPLFHHGNWMHLIGNMYFLLLFGVVLENLLGPLKFTLLYLLSGVASHVIYTLIDWIGIIDAPPTLGASAAIYGVMAGVFVLYPALKIECIFFFITLIRFMTIPAKYLIGFYIFFDLIRMPFMQIYGVNFIGHISGFACVYFYLKHKEKKRLPLNSL